METPCPSRLPTRPSGGASTRDAGVSRLRELPTHLEGRAGTTMRAFGTELDDVELAALMTYQRNAFGNATGDLVQPATVAVARLNLGD